MKNPIIFLQYKTKIKQKKKRMKEWKKTEAKLPTPKSDLVNFKHIKSDEGSCLA